jgi:hypothetical protein
VVKYAQELFTIYGLSLHIEGQERSIAPYNFSDRRSTLPRILNKYCTIIILNQNGLHLAGSATGVGN